MIVNGEGIDSLKGSLLARTGDFGIFSNTVCLMKIYSKMKMSIMQVLSNLKELV